MTLKKRLKMSLGVALAGLGLLGFVARRRKHKAVPAALLSCCETVRSIGL